MRFLASALKQLVWAFGAGADITFSVRLKTATEALATILLSFVSFFFTLGVFTMLNFKAVRKGFTLVELLVVIAIIG